MLKKRSFWIVSMTAAVALSLALFIGFTIRAVNQRITQSCFEELVRTSKQLAAELLKTSEMDRSILTSMAALLASGEARDDDAQSEILQSCDCSASYLSYVELLRPDNTLLGADGSVRDAAGTLDFAEEAARGAYISGLAQSVPASEEKVVRSAAPVVRHGETVAILYGVVRLSELAQTYKTTIYDGNAYVYLEDGDTGELLLDTWNKTLGNIYDLSGRQTLPGYDFEDAAEDWENGCAGDLAFVSRTTGGVLYMHYEPVGINNWNVVVTVEKEYALRESLAIRSLLYHMAAVVGAVGLVYMVCVLLLLFRAYRRAQKLGLLDQTTGLQNRNAFERFAAERQKKVFGSIVCVYVDANGLHDINNRYGHAVGDQMLRMVTEALQSRFDHTSIYRIGGDEFLVYCEDGDADVCAEKMLDVASRIEAHSYSVSYGIACYKNEMGVERVTREADERMLENKRAYYQDNDRRRH